MGCRANHDLQNLARRDVIGDIPHIEFEELRSENQEVPAMMAGLKP